MTRCVRDESKHATKKSSGLMLLGFANALWAIGFFFCLPLLGRKGLLGFGRLCLFSAGFLMPIQGYGYCHEPQRPRLQNVEATLGGGSHQVHRSHIHRCRHHPFALLSVCGWREAACEVFCGEHEAPMSSASCGQEIQL